MMMMPITNRIPMNRSRARFTKTTKSNHHHALRHPCSPGGARRPPSSFNSVEGDLESRIDRSLLLSITARTPRGNAVHAPSKFGRELKRFARLGAQGLGTLSDEPGATIAE